MIGDQPRAVSMSEETFRAVFPGRDPNGDSNTVIVTRQGLGRDARVWLTFCGAIKTTVVMTDGEAADLRELLAAATKRKGAI